MAKNFAGIKNQRYGVELECSGLSRSSAAKAVAKVLGGSPEHYGGSYDRYDVKDSKNRTWKIMSDFLYIFSADQYFHLFLELCLYAVIEFSAFDLFVIFHDVILQFVMVL